MTEYIYIWFDEYNEIFYIFWNFSLNEWVNIALRRFLHFEPISRQKEARSTTKPVNFVSVFFYSIKAGIAETNRNLQIIFFMKVTQMKSLIEVTIYNRIFDKFQSHFFVWNLKTHMYIFLSQFLASNDDK